MSLAAPLEVLDSLKTSKQKLVEFSSQLTRASKWDEAQSTIEWIKQIDGMVSVLSQNNVTMPAPQVRSLKNSTHQTSSIQKQLPYYYIEGDKLIKVGKGREGGTYRHRVTIKNFKIVLEQLSKLAVSTQEFETQRLIDRCFIPRHEPRIVVSVLGQYGLLTELRRGRWQFEDVDSFSDKASSIWQRLPRQ